MASRFTQAIVLGLLVGAAGAVIFASPLGAGLEEAVGLDVLFRVRGPRRPPPETLIVSIDKVSAERLGLPAAPSSWPRSLHARLVDRLTDGGAAVVVFDVVFEEPRTPEGDAALANAIRRAGNVVLCEFLKRTDLPGAAGDGTPSDSARVVRLVPPIPLLAGSAAALAPFPLPKIPVKVSRYWAFDTQAGETPTLPVVAFHVFAGPGYGEFLQRVADANPAIAGDLPRAGAGGLLSGVKLSDAVRDVRDVFERTPECAGRTRDHILTAKGAAADARSTQAVRSLIDLYDGPNDRYLDFYGPPRTIPTVSFYRFVGGKDSADRGGPVPDVRGKAVFVGLSEALDPDQRDSHFSVFSKPDGMDLSGVEIAATSFANLVEDRPVRPLPLSVALGAIVLWGAVTGALCRLLAPLRAVLALAVLLALYFAAAAYRFDAAGAWHPLVIPLLVQPSLSAAGTVLLRYAEAKTERRAIREAFEYYLPVEVVDRLSRDVTAVRTESATVYGVCLSTDAENYTSFAEARDPKELARAMNAYYASLFAPVKRHGGEVSNVVADAMLALWVTATPHGDPREKALLAALEIAGGAAGGGTAADVPPLVTRVGLNAGNILLGNLGAIDHFEYRPVGDIVNSAARIEGLNKRLGTRLLASDETVRGLEGFLAREVGTFLLAGKANPVTVHEVAGRGENVPAQRKDGWLLFAAGLAAFRKGSWDEAASRFREADRCIGGDGPSVFYVRLCGQYRAAPPEEAWTGAVSLETK